ncbi:MAG: hypothetical protein RL291_1356 [Pseudomonadota bacterium]
MARQIVKQDIHSLVTVEEFDALLRYALAEFADRAKDGLHSNNLLGLYTAILIDLQSASTIPLARLAERYNGNQSRAKTQAQTLIEMGLLEVLSVETFNAATNRTYTSLAYRVPEALKNKLMARRAPPAVVKKRA